MDRIPAILIVGVVFLMLAVVLFVPMGRNVESAPDSDTHALVRDIYGFWPYWVDPNSYNPKWGDLSYVMYFSILTLSDGSLDYSHMDDYDVVAREG